MDSLPSIETQDIAHSSSPSTRPKNYFKEWAANGYRVIPVIPGGAETVPGCDPGKTPGHIHKGGKWGPLKGWRTLEPTPELLEKWHRQGANIGLPRGDAFMIDIDAYEEAQADRIEAIALEMLGPAPCRVGSWPKRALLYRADGDVSMVPKVIFASAGGTNGKGQVEIPAQVVVQGRHAAGHEYTWPRKPKPLDKLTTVTHADLVAFMDAVAKEMPDADFSGGAAPKGAVDQHLLVAPDLAHFERAVKALPNTTANAPDYDSMIKVMYAIDAGCGDDKALSNELVHHWCAKWHDYDQEITESRWQRMQGVEKRVGARFVYQMVSEHASDAGLAWEDAWLEDLPPEPEPEDRPAPLRAGRVRPEDLESVPPRSWLYGTKLLRKYVTFIASPGGVGKTAYAFAMALACATQRELLHDRVHSQRPLNVWIFNLEDDIQELRRRLKAALMHYDIPLAALEHIRLNSGRDRGVRVLKQGKEGFIVQPDKRALIEEMRREQIDLAIFDPFLRTHGVPENESEGQDAVMSQFADIAEATNAAILLIHHTKKGAVAGDMDSMRGSSTQGGGARAVFTMAAMAPEDAAKLGIPEAERRRYVRIDDAKANMAPPLAKTEWVRLESVTLGNFNEEYPKGDSVQVVAPWTPPDAWEGVLDREAEILVRISEGPGEGERYSARPQDRDRWAGLLIMEQCDKTREQAKEILAEWTKAGRIEVREYYSEGQRKTRRGLFVPQRPASSVFD